MDVARSSSSAVEGRNKSNGLGCAWSVHLNAWHPSSKRPPKICCYSGLKKNLNSLPLTRKGANSPSTAACVLRYAISYSLFHQFLLPVLADLVWCLWRQCKTSSFTSFLAKQVAVNSCQPKMQFHWCFFCGPAWNLHALHVLKWQCIKWQFISNGPQCLMMTNKCINSWCWLSTSLIQFSSCENWSHLAAVMAVMQKLEM